MPKQKRTYASGRENRKSFLFTNQLNDLLKQRSTELGISQNEIAADAIFDYLTRRSNFIICPTCDAYIAQREKISVGGVGEMECTQCKTRIWYDLDEDKILKMVKAAIL